MEEHFLTQKILCIQITEPQTNKLIPNITNTLSADYCVSQSQHTTSTQVLWSLHTERGKSIMSLEIRPTRRTGMLDQISSPSALI